MFNADMMESKTNRVEIVDFSETAVRGMLQFLYTDKTTISLEFGAEWFQILDKYLLHTDEAERAFGANIKEKTVLDFYNFAHVNNFTVLKAMAVQFIKW